MKKKETTDKGKPEYGKQYRLTGGPDTPAISNGNTWAESEVKDYCQHCGALMKIRQVEGWIDEVAMEYDNEMS